MRRFSRPAIIAAGISTGFATDAASIRRANRVARDFDRGHTSLDGNKISVALDKAEQKREKRRIKRLAQK